MSNGKGISLERVTGRENEYIIKDTKGITAGRVFITELNEEIHSCMARIRYYREENYGVLKEALNILLRTLFKSRSIYKVNILVDEHIDTRAFSDLGFELEGIAEDNIHINGVQRSELLFGVTSRNFENINRNNTLILRGKNLDMRVLTPENCGELLDYNIRNKEHLKYFEPGREESFYTIEAQRRILSEGYKQYLNGTSINFGIYKDNKFIGKLQMSNVVYGIFRSAFVGYSIDEKEQGKGYMKEALLLAVDYAFDDMELHRIEASTLTDNIKSQRVLLACGFTELGINKNYLYINGGWRDHKTFYKIND